MVRVDVAGRGQELLAALPGRTAELLADGTVEVSIAGDEDLDVIVAAVGDAGLPLHGLTSQRSSLDDVFLAGSGTGTA